MPKYIKENFFTNPEDSFNNDNKNKELYKIKMNEKYDIEICFNFYWKNYVKDPKIFEGAFGLS